MYRKNIFLSFLFALAVILGMGAETAVRRAGGTRTAGRTTAIATLPGCCTTTCSRDSDCDARCGGKGTGVCYAQSSCCRTCLC